MSEVDPDISIKFRKKNWISKPFVLGKIKRY
jgi:hypothetical protein